MIFNGYDEHSNPTFNYSNGSTFINRDYDPAFGFDPVSWLMNLASGNNSHGEENEYWRAYLGLDNNVPKMLPAAKTSWDDKANEFSH